MFSVAMVQLCRQLALPFWGHVFSCHGSTLSSTRVAFLGPGFQLPWFNFVVNSRCLFGARFSVAMVQLCRQLALPFWGQVFSCHGSTLSPTRVAFLGPGFQLPWFNFVVESRCLFGTRAGSRKFPYHLLVQRIWGLTGLCQEICWKKTDFMSLII
jgi:hypothetical protein